MDQTKKINELLYSLYYNLENETAYSSKNKIFNKAKSLNKSVTFKHVTDWFQKQYSPSIHKPIVKKIKRSKTFVKGPFEQFQIDLADLSNISKHNNNFKYLLFCIDIFTKYLFVVPIKSKHGINVATALESI